MFKKAISSEIFGMGVSIICIIHCFAMPLTAALFPLIFTGHDHHKLFEIIFIGLMTLALMAFVKGYKHHHSKKALTIAIIGIAVVIVSIFIEDYKVVRVLSVLGGFLVLMAHYWNYRLCRTIACKDHHHH